MKTRLGEQEKGLELVGFSDNRHTNYYRDSGRSNRHLGATLGTGMYNFLCVSVSPLTSHFQSIVSLWTLTTGENNNEEEHRRNDQYLSTNPLGKSHQHRHNEAIAP
jgi:hypothetical protein